MRQSTIARPVECEGAGLHSGQHARIRLEPAPANTGIVFVRAPASASLAPFEIPARVGRVHSSSRATTLSIEGEARTGGSVASRADESLRVATVEHLLASLYAHEIENVRIQIEGPEIPALDGSAAPLFALIGDAGRVQLAEEAPVVALTETIEIRDGERWIRADPLVGALRITYAIDFDHPLIGRQVLEIPRLDALSFGAELASARTFGFEGEVESLRKSGLGLGGDLDNTIVLGPAKILNKGGLRYADECVRHKVIDLVGDLALLGARLHAHVRVERGGHALHHQLVRAIDEARQAGAGTGRCESAVASAQRNSGS